eukprot:1824035-Rhodomonas_salina.2
MFSSSLPSRERHVLSKRERCLKVNWSAALLSTLPGLVLHEKGRHSNPFEHQQYFWTGPVSDDSKERLETTDRITSSMRTSTSDAAPDG